MSTKSQEQRKEIENEESILNVYKQKTKKYVKHVMVSVQIAMFKVSEILL